MVLRWKSHVKKLGSDHLDHQDHQVEDVEDQAEVEADQVEDVEDQAEVTDLKADHVEALTKIALAEILKDVLKDVNYLKQQKWIHIMLRLLLM